jgi:two-component system, chemotaxis family, protein-glutamate methylesterase/glutaminase
MSQLTSRSVEACGSTDFLVVVAASAGGLRALERLLATLPSGFPAAVMVVQHLDRNHPSLLAKLLSRHTQLPLREARQGDVLTAGHVYIAPRDHHLLAVDAGMVALTRGELVHYVRPSADVLFESAAQTFGPRTIAVVLTGTGLDGADGVKAVKRCGGTVIAQDQASSEFFSMPDAAIRTGGVDFVLPLMEIGPKLVSLVELSQRPT